jgi:hypothetical protein
MARHQYRRRVRRRMEDVYDTDDDSSLSLRDVASAMEFLEGCLERSVVERSYVGSGWKRRFEELERSSRDITLADGKCRDRSRYVIVADMWREVQLGMKTMMLLLLLCAGLRCQRCNFVQAAKEAYTSR